MDDDGDGELLMLMLMLIDIDILMLADIDIDVLMLLMLQTTMVSGIFKMYQLKENKYSLINGGLGYVSHICEKGKPTWKILFEIKI